MTKSIWIDKGNQPNVTKLQPLGITRPLFDITDPQVNHTFLDKWRQPPFDSAGVYACANWDVIHETDPVAFAHWLSNQLVVVAPGTGSTFPHVTVNVESQWVVGYPGAFPSYMTVFFKTWRALRPQRATTWTLDGFQGGWWNNRADDLLAIEAANLEEIQAECFGEEIVTPTGTVLEPFDVAGTILDLQTYGFVGNLVPCHDAARLYRGWYGAAFTQGRLA